MAKSKRRRRAKNKIEAASSASSDGAVIKADSALPAHVPAVVYRAQTVARSTLFSAEFERVIEIIATERVRLAMLATRRLRLLAAPLPAPSPPRLLAD
jgi:hypothetical protein